MLKPITKLGIKGKLVLIFVIIKVIPLILLSWFSINEVDVLENKIENKLSSIIVDTQLTVVKISDTASENSINALDVKAREYIEHLSRLTAKLITDFLYERDVDILDASRLKPTVENYSAFLKNHKREIIDHNLWIYDSLKDNWKPSENYTSTLNVKCINDENNKGFSYHPPYLSGVRVKIPVYLEITFFDLDGNEKIKLTTNNILSSEKKNISNYKNTFCKAERYYDKIVNLKEGEIYVSPVIGEYVGSKIIGVYNKEACRKANIPFEPENSAYAGKENPLGKRFRGLVRWITPVIQNGKKVGYVTLALDHTHLMEFTDHVVTTNEIFSPISDASTGNYAFMWDNKGRCISHPRDYFIVGYNKQTGVEEVPWLDKLTYIDWIKSTESFEEFRKTLIPFNNQSRNISPSLNSIRNGKIALDGRYLKFAPQCTGWHNLTQYGGSGSFIIQWSGLCKITAAAAIKYYTGDYAKSKRGFGYVTAGVNINQFHQAAISSKKEIEAINKKYIKHLSDERKSINTFLESSSKQIVFELSIVTFLMVCMVIFIALLVADKITNRLHNIIEKVRLIGKGDYNIRINDNGHDEITYLAHNIDDMTNNLDKSMKELEKAKIAAEESERIKDLFLINMSHEIRTPINGIIGIGKILENSQLTKEQKEYVKSLNISSNALLHVIDDILDFGKAKNGKIQLNKVEFNILEMLNDLIDMFKDSASKKHLTIHYNIGEDVNNVVYGDKNRINQILINMLGNAIKFTRRGSIKIVVCVYEKNDDTTTLKFSVIDQGIGIPSEKHKTIFRAFEQIDSAYNRHHNGTGLGLSICKELVKLMHGEIGISSKLGIGSTFWFTIPFKNNYPSNKIIDNDSNNDLNFSGKKILVVEDNNINATIIEQLLSKFGLNVRIASSGKEALVMLRNKFDLIFMDIQMPNMDGFETIHEIRKREKENNLEKTPIVVLTAHVMQEHRDQCLESGADGFMSKPIDNDILTDILIKFLSLNI